MVARIARGAGTDPALVEFEDDLSLIYRALAEGQVDVIAGDATSALIQALDLAPLSDTRHYFPRPGSLVDEERMVSA